MKLPNAFAAVVPRAKITHYLLSSAHRTRRSKAEFFTRFGFSIERWEELAAALVQHANEHDIAQVEASPFGVRYVIEGLLRSPDRRNPRIRAIWFVETGEDRPRFVTAYPVRAKGH